MLPHISESINQSALKTFGLKIKKKKRGRKLPRSLIDLIQAKNTLARTLHHSSKLLEPTEVTRLQAELVHMKAQIKDNSADFRLARRNRIRSKLLLSDPTRKKFWRFLKNQIKAAGNISALYDKENKMVFNSNEIEEAVLHHFGKIFDGKRHPVFPIPDSLDQTELSILEINQILSQSPPSFKPDQFEEQVCPPFSFIELDESLGNLPSGKASGYDKIPNELLKNSSFNFKQYLLMFLNKILEDGFVPQNLNLGKCMLIHKVCNNKLKTFL